MRNRKRQLVVECYPPWKVRLLWLSLLAVAVVCAWLYFFYLPQQLQGYGEQQEAERLRLMHLLRDGKREQDRLQALVAGLQRQQRLQRESAEQVQQLLQQREQEALELQEKLAFYQAIVSSEDPGAGIKVQTFRLTKGKEKRHYRYRLVLIQSMRGNRPVRGSFSLKVAGVRDGLPMQLGMADVTRPALKERKLDFRYFQDVDGDLYLPQGFVPRKVYLRVRAQPPHRDIRKAFDWQQLTG